MAEYSRPVACLAKDVEVLGRAGDAGIGAYGEGSGHEERNAAVQQLANRMGVEGLGLGAVHHRFSTGIDRDGGGEAVRIARHRPSSFCMDENSPQAPPVPPCTREEGHTPSRGLYRPGRSYSRRAATTRTFVASGPVSPISST